MEVVNAGIDDTKILTGSKDRDRLSTNSNVQKSLQKKMRSPNEGEKRKKLAPQDYHALIKRPMAARSPAEVLPPSFFDTPKLPNFKIPKTRPTSTSPDLVVGDQPSTSSSIGSSGKPEACTCFSEVTIRNPVDLKLEQIHSHSVPKSEPIRISDVLEDRSLSQPNLYRFKKFRVVDDEGNASFKPVWTERTPKEKQIIEKLGNVGQNGLECSGPIDRSHWTSLQIKGNRVDYLKISNNRFTKVTKKTNCKNRQLNEPENVKVFPKEKKIAFTQKLRCCELTNVTKCKDCYEADEADFDKVVCRFQEFRRFEREPLPNGTDPGESRFFRSSDISMEEDKWLPSSGLDVPTGLTTDIACYILQNICQAFKGILDREIQTMKLARELNEANNAESFWKRLQQSRETCDICDGTIFNLHFICESCGFTTCSVCLQKRLAVDEKQQNRKLKDHFDLFGWPHCHQDQSHVPETLRLTSIIPDSHGDLLSTIFRLDADLQKVMNRFNIPNGCGCPEDSIDSGFNDTASSDHVCFCQKASEPLKVQEYLCNGNLLLIEDSHDPNMLAIFQKHWRSAKPIIVANQQKDLIPELWKPESFRKMCIDGDDLVADSVQECRTSGIYPLFSATQFWNGFVDCTKRLKDDKGNQLRLKLKDWPPNGRFVDRLPSHYGDFLKALPIHDYTNPTSGPFNLATRLADFFLRPDLGPKLYNAYEMLFLTLELGTTNLHLDVSDAVNILVTVFKAEPVGSGYYYEELIDHIKTVKVDPASIKRVEANPAKAGAIWSIFRPEDTEKIREYLTLNAPRYKLKLAEDSDPVHDQLIYLTCGARQELSEQYNVESFTFVQMEGDCVFIPAGAPHQVQNLQCCVKVAEDFVSPEGVYSCSRVSDEFRKLSKEHTNHEDKLQLDSIIYYSVRDAVSTLQQAMPSMEATKTD